MVEIIPFKAEHVLQIDQQVEMFGELAKIPFEYWKKVELKKWQYTIKINDKIQACCGVIEIWKGRAECWATIDKNSGSVFVSLVRTIESLYYDNDCERIEATVKKDFKQGHRLAKILGFSLEAETLKKYGVDGSDYSLYAKVR